MIRNKHVDHYIKLYKSGKIKLNNERIWLTEYLEKHVLNRDDLYFDDKMIDDCISFGEKWYFPLHTAEKLRQLREAQEQVRQQFKRGEIDEGQYRAFQRELIATEGRLQHFESQLQETQQEVDDIGERMEALGNKFKGVGDGMKNVGGTMSTAFTAPILGGLALLLKVQMNLGRI